MNWYRLDGISHPESSGSSNGALSGTITEDMHHSYEWLQSKNEVDEDTCELHQELIDELIKSGGCRCESICAVQMHQP